MFLTIVSALAPVACVIAIGYFLKRRRVIEDRFWDGADKLVYWVFLPALVIDSVATAALRAGPAAGIGVAVLGGVFAVAGGLALARPLLAGRLGLTGPAYTSLLQGSMRTNVFIGLAVVSQLYGAEGLALFSIGIAWVVPTVNTLSVVALLRHGREAKGGGPMVVLLALARNPLIIAIAIGLALNVTGLGTPPVIDDVLGYIGAVAIPLALLSVGAGLDLAKLRKPGWRLGTAGVLKLLVLPAVTWAIGSWIGLDAMTLGLAVMIQCWPTSVSTYTLARQMGGDAPLMAEILSAQTIAAALTAPLVLILFVL